MVGSINGRLAEQTHAAYDTSKGAVEMMVRTLCVELAPHGIRVNGIAPGLFRTPLTSAALDDPRFLEWMQRHTPNGQVPGPEVAGEAAVFLLSDAASHIHGQMLLIDGGMSVWQQPNPF
jgi:NAD(P)-dependent dehydrogenase (short-subunit alcohol dehydrogenase family)